ncbi:eukaryotic and archaeal DNA primase, large subunit-domain-containing protein [Mycotypha africana]|uniref:eukaryotic and archaeal DNA primase, large subunit-domain-containing protein n=1 Tax=Mycotypha africana TaxID=64632 RepID=UPI002300F556|nr:eukaryotic and archaeal DNA primase, large subunit-domain-containing protein [Mycotypha africana]KAI8987309.1 eukaryotic and archaeal DNA primase, large subunit-domain-containing protein [Mycotypha africana]
MDTATNNTTHHHLYQNDNTTNSTFDSEDEHDDLGYDITEFDLDVVDDALLNPNSKEYMDHFGFRIQVRTDDEESSDDGSMSDYSPVSVGHPQQQQQHQEEQHKDSLDNEDEEDVVIKRATRTNFSPISTTTSMTPTTTTTTTTTARTTTTANNRSDYKRLSHQEHKLDSDEHLALKKDALAYLKQLKEQDQGSNDKSHIDWTFWESVIHNFGDIVENQYDKIQEHLIHGIPSLLRGYLWQIISKSADQTFRMKDSDNMAYYTDILVRKSTSHFEKQIQRDVPRTFPGHPFFQTETGRRSLFNVAKAYNKMEYAAFCILVKLMGKYGLRGHFTPHMDLLHQHLYQFDNVFQQKLPVVHRHLEREGVTPSMYASQWFIPLFSYCNQQQQKQVFSQPWMEFLFRIMDLLLVEGTHILIQIALALVIRNQDKLLGMKFERLVSFLCHDIFSVYIHATEEGAVVVDVDQFVQDVYRVELPPKFMARLAQQYWNQQQQHSVGGLENLRRINGQLSEHIRSVEGTLQALRQENQELTNQVISSKMDMARTEDEKEQLRYELAQVRAEFEQYKQEENAQLVQKNVALASQLTETETMLIELKMQFAERETATDAAQRFGNRGGRNNSELLKEYPFRLNFYLKVPTSEITIEEFETFALDRLQGDLYIERRKDHISHFVLRMAYCRNLDLRKWFVNQELALFKIRFDQESMEEKKRFLASLNLNWEMISMEEKESLRKELTTCSRCKPGINADDYVTNETFFKVDFWKVPELVGTRSVFVKRGKAYVPMKEQVNLVMTEFRNYLERALNATSKILPRLEEDDRLKPILQNVEKQYVGKMYNGEDAGSDGHKIKASEVDALVKAHAPLGMRHLHNVLRAKKHLKHGGRLQYGLFLKGIGLPLEEALIFWRQAFSEITDDKFRKEYQYNIRHMYGLEGSRHNYKPFSCMKIITSNQPGPGDDHGCPYKHWSPQNLEAALRKDGLNNQQVQEILELSRNKHYQVALTRHFEFLHPNMKQKIDTIEHPNEYYELSKQYAEEQQQQPSSEDAQMEVVEEEGAATERAVSAEEEARIEKMLADEEALLDETMDIEGLTIGS